MEAISDAAAGQPKPVVASVVTADGHLPADGPAGMPNFLFPESCAAVLARGAERRAWLSRPLGRRPSYDDSIRRRPARSSRRDSKATAPSWLGTADGAALLATHGIATVASRRCADVDARSASRRSIAGPSR